MPATSRTERATTCSDTNPSQRSEASGPIGLRPRVGLRPTRPQCEAGIRIDPPPSPACAKGTMRAATAAPEPPLEPPGVCHRCQGLRQGPRNSGSVTPMMPSSGVLVRPMTISPEPLKRRTSSQSALARKPARSLVLPVDGCPASSAPRSLSKKGTPMKGGKASPASSRSSTCLPRSSARARARAKLRCTTALSFSLRDSTRSMAASTSSLGVRSLRATSWARPVAS